MPTLRKFHIFIYDPRSVHLLIKRLFSRLRILAAKVPEQLSKTWNKTYDGVLSDDKCYATRCITICHELELCYGTILKANVEFTFFVELEGENVFLFRTTLERNCCEEVNTAVRIRWLFIRIAINFETSERLDTFLTKAFEMKPLVFQLVLLVFSSLVLAG